MLDKTRQGAHCSKKRGSLEVLRVITSPDLQYSPNSRWGLRSMLTHRKHDGVSNRLATVKFNLCWRVKPVSSMGNRPGQQEIRRHFHAFPLRRLQSNALQLLTHQNHSQQTSARKIPNNPKLIACSPGLVANYLQYGLMSLLKEFSWCQQLSYAIIIDTT